jgi:hypothetical protein
MMKSLISAALLCLSLSIHAQIVLVSDIDDTIKVSHILDKDSAAANVLMLKNAFIGMPELYQLISQLPEISGVKYLSNAPKKLFGDLNEKFIKLNKFPRGELAGRQLRLILKGKKHKLESLHRYVRELRPRDFILIGDNGEADVEVYAEIRKIYPQIGGVTYIRQVYSKNGFKGKKGKPLQKGQVGFSSSVDIALDLLNRGYLKMDAVESHIRQVVPRILSENDHQVRGHQMAYPEWMDCRDFTLAEMPLLLDIEAQELLSKYVAKVGARCSRKPFDD